MNQTGPGGNVEAMAAVQEAKKAVSAATNPTDACEALIHLAHKLGFTGNTSYPAFISSAAYLSLVKFLISEALPEWSACFTKNDRRAALDCYFDGFSQFPVLVALLSALAWAPQNSLGISYVVERIGVWVDGIDPSSLFEGVTDSSSSLWHENCTYVVSLPDRVANAVGKLPETHRRGVTIPSSLHPRPFSEKVVSCLIDYALKHGNMILELAGDLLGRMVTSGYSSTIMIELARIVQKEGSTTDVMARVQGILTHFSDAAAESLLHTLMSRAAEYADFSEVLESLFLHLARSNARVLYLLTVKCVLHKTYSTNAAVGLVSLLGKGPSKAGYEKDSPSEWLLNAIRQAVNAWGDKSCTKALAAGQHQYLSRVIDLMLKSGQISKEVLNREELLIPLLTGVQSHIESPIPEFRKEAKNVALSFSMIIDPSRPLILDMGENHSDEDSAPVTDDGSPKVEQLSSTVESHTSSKSSTANNKKKEIVEDPDKPLFGGSETEEDEDEEEDEDDDSLPAYDLNDDESDLNPVKKPHYLRECLSWLRIGGDNPDLNKLEGAIVGAEELIRKNHPDLDPLAVELAQALVNLRNTYSFENFTKNRRGAMISLCVCATVPVVEFFTRRVYEENSDMQARLDILEALVGGAAELSSVEPQSIEEFAEEDDPKDLTPDDVIKARLETKTRRWAKPRKPAPVPKKNRFHGVATNFFYPLLKDIDSTSPSLNLAGQDYFVLGRVIYSLGFFVECAGNAPSTRRMVMVLLAVVFAFRFHPQPHVRQCAWFAMSRCLLVMPKHLFMKDFAGEVDEIQSWIQVTVSKEADRTCRGLAMYCASLLHDQLKYAPKDEEPVLTMPGSGPSIRLY